MRRFLVISIPIVTLVFFVMVMLSGDLLKQPLWGDDNIPQFIETLVQDINHENWEAAKLDTENLNRVWDKVVNRVNSVQNVMKLTLSQPILPGLGVLYKRKINPLV
ncbi:hypothetical protein JCM17380_07530 [Desulfosporosinus burensis]